MKKGLFILVILVALYFLISLFHVFGLGRNIEEFNYGFFDIANPEFEMATKIIPSILFFGGMIIFFLESITNGVTLNGFPCLQYIILVSSSVLISLLQNIGEIIISIIAMMVLYLFIYSLAFFIGRKKGWDLRVKPKNALLIVTITFILYKFYVLQSVAYGICTLYPVAKTFLTNL